MTTPSRRAQLEAMLAEDLNDPLLRYMLAMEHVSAGAPAEAVTVFRALLERSPQYVPAYMQFGQTLSRLGQTDEARAVWQRGVTQARLHHDDHAAGEMQGMIDMLE